MKLVQLMYSSTLKNKHEALIADILTTSQRNNLRNAITGMIFHTEDRLVQVIEGPSSSVDSLYKKISCDSRHYNLNFIGSKRIERREYLEWDMGYLKIYDVDIDQSFGRHAVFRVGSHHLDERSAYAIACEVLRSFSGAISSQSCH